MHLHDDILGSILERIDSHVSLIRAASTCKRWRSIIANASFLLRFRSLHAPAVAGDYCNYSPMPTLPDGVVPRTKDPVFFIPSPSSSIDVGHFSLDFLPADRPKDMPWNIQDNRGSLLLIDRLRIGKGDNIFRDLIVCEPLTRLYQKIPPPLDLMDGIKVLYFRRFYLLDGAVGDEAGSSIGMSNFRVLCMHYDLNGVMHAVVFNSGGRGSFSWKEKDISNIVRAAGQSHMCELGRAAGSWYLCEEYESNTLIILDGRTGEFSSSLLPANENWDRRTFCVTDGKDSKPRICAAVEDSMKVFAMISNSEWAVEKILPLVEAIRCLPVNNPLFSSNQPCRILTRGPGFIIVSLGALAVLIDLMTMETAPGMDDMGPVVYRYELPWPPMLKACMDN